MSNKAGGVTLELLGTLLRDMQAEQRDMKALLREQHTLLMLLAEQGRRTDRHIAELKDELELMLKTEVMGRLGFFETRTGHRLNELEDRIAAIEARLPAP